MNGRIKTIVSEKRFGFIESHELVRVEYFFHKDDFIGHWDDLTLDFSRGKNIIVEFEIGHSTKGPRAANVKRADHPNQAV